ncbi:MAG TPA: OsmC family protein [Solirubrobacterales bacterium]|nr:OsmC family protein [Solirubrobacterales bacterium]
MKVVARRREGYVHEVEIEGGHSVVVDEPAFVEGGTDAGPSPTRLVAAGLAGCVAVTTEMYAKRKGWDIGAVQVEVDVEYEEFAPRSFAVTLRLPAGLTGEQRKRLLAVAGKCPVHELLTGETEVTVSDRIAEL